MDGELINHCIRNSIMYLTNERFIKQSIIQFINNSIDSLFDRYYSIVNRSWLMVLAQTPKVCQRFRVLPLAMIYKPCPASLMNAYMINEWFTDHAVEESLNRRINYLIINGSWFWLKGRMRARISVFTLAMKFKGILC